MRINIYSEKNQRAEKDSNSIEINELSQELCPNHSIDDIIIDEALSYTNKENMLKCIQFCVSKIRLGGSIYIRDVELDSLALSLVNKTIETDEFNILINTKSFLHSLHDIRKIIMETNLTIDTMNINNNMYTLKCFNNG